MIIIFDLMMSSHLWMTERDMVLSQTTTWIHLRMPLSPLGWVYNSKDIRAWSCSSYGTPFALTTEVAADTAALLCLLYCLQTKCSTKCKGLLHSFTACAKDIFCKHTQKLLPRKVLSHPCVSHNSQIVIMTIKKPRIIKPERPTEKVLPLHVALTRQKRVEQ